MAKGDYCAVHGCSNDRRYPEKQMIKPHVGILRFYLPKTQKDIVKWRKLLNRKHFKVTSNTKVCSNHFQAGYRSEECPDPKLYLKGYCPDKQKKTRPNPESLAPKPKRQRRSNICLSDSYSDYSEFDVSHAKSQSVSTLSKEIYCSHIHNNVKKEPEDDFSESSSSFSSLFFNGSDEISNDYDTSVEIDVSEENGKKSRRELFVKQATSNRNCFRYTGVTRENLDLVFDLIKGKTKSLRYWKGSVDTPGSRREKRRAQTRLLSCWVEFVLTLVRTRKGFDVHFLADTFGISVIQVSRIYNTWIIFLSEELSFLVPRPSRGEIKSVLPEQFQRIPNIRVIIDCCEFYIQKPLVP
ncbi:nuclease HARBI1 [Paramuricea clavata]|uniref:Nuclease HARBI1 n=1 Tax=Paramuricea clavata TaxID=317549 RepID=A0A6S7I7Q4_PARCT|nr:nuclease HARBI1 [Paramuricea clavata]